MTPTTPFLPGFDPRWRDPTDYILGITEDIWERRRIDTLHAYYGPELVVRSPASVVVGNAGIVGATMATLAEFPDRELPGEDVIWHRTGADAFLSSHRLICSATHLGAGAYGPPTGRRVMYRIIADCWCRANAVQDEWLVRDQGAIVRQMGHDVWDWTRDLIAREGGPEACVRPFVPEIDVPGPYDGRGTEGGIGAEAEGLLQDLLAGRTGGIRAGYGRAARLSYPGHYETFGRAAADRFWLGLRSALPDAEARINHVIGRADAGQPPRAALRWSLDGRHDGHGAFGPPTGARVHVMGMTHLEFGPQGVRAECTLYDETAVAKQILLATGRV
ncbi:MAG: ester cyclase [Shimia sp.]